MINFNQVQFSYDRKPPLFDNLSFTLTKGKTYGLLGRNGVGKTSLLRIVTGQSFPQRGGCQVFGHLAHQRNIAMLADIFYISEDFILPPLSPRKYCKIYAPFYPRFNHQAFFDSLNALELAADHNLRASSYGQQKKFMLAFALATGCRLLIFDEPTNGLDIPTKSSLRRLLSSGADESRLMIIATHQVKELQELINHVLILENGKLIFSHPMAAINASLTVETSAEKPADGNPLHFEEIGGGGYRALCSTSATPPSAISLDLELLFNAVIADPNRINRAITEGRP